jgi:hypothetical protein
MSDIVLAMIAPAEEWPAVEWRRLDAWTRRAVLRNARELWPYPDPSVGAIAARHARSYLDAPRRARERRVTRIAAVVSVVLTIATTAWVSSGPVLVLIWAIGIAATAAAFTLFGVYQARVTRFSRVELAHKLALERTLAAGAWWVLPPAMREPLAGFAARYEPRRVRRDIARMFVGLPSLIPGGLIMHGSTGSDQLDMTFRVTYAALIAIGIVLLALRLRPLVRVMVKPRPLVTLDAGGVHLPDLGCSLPWAELAEVRLFRRRGGYQRSSQPAVLVAFVPRDPASVLRSLRPTGLRHWRLQRALRLRGTPLTVEDRLADRSGPEIAAAVRAFAPVPVHWYY